MSWFDRGSSYSCTSSCNYCSLKRVWQINGQLEEHSIPTITVGAGIKLTICNVNHLSAPGLGELHNQPGQSPEEINPLLLPATAYSPLSTPQVIYSSPSFPLSYLAVSSLILSLYLSPTISFLSLSFFLSLSLSLLKSNVLLGSDFPWSGIVCHWVRMAPLCYAS